MTKAQIQELVAALENDISDRRGLSAEWDAIDDDVKQDIRDAWAALIKKHLEAAKLNAP